MVTDLIAPRKIFGDFLRKAVELSRIRYYNVIDRRITAEKGAETVQIMISPAKNMREDLDGFAPEGSPPFLDDTEELRQYLLDLGYEGCQTLWNCNESIASRQFHNLQEMDFRARLTPAVFAYDGLQYRHMAPKVFTVEELSYIRQHLYILSGFYGALRAFDGVTPYRLEMQAKLPGFRCRTLYEFWGSRLAEVLTEQDTVLLDLASKEYSKAVRPWLSEKIRCVEVIFAERIGGTLKEKGTQAKMARGAMVRYLAKIGAETPEEARGFSDFQFAYCAEESTPTRMVFVKGV